MANDRDVDSSREPAPVAGTAPGRGSAHDRSGPGRSTPAGGGLPRGRRRETALADGSRLVLQPDRSIIHVGADGTAIASWAAEDPGWERHAIRFGLRPLAHTANPHDRRIRESKPHGW